MAAGKPREQRWACWGGRKLDRAGIRRAKVAQQRKGQCTPGQGRTWAQLGGMESREGKEEGAALTSQYPEPPGPGLRVTNSGALLQRGQGPGPWAASRCSALPRAPIPLPRGMSLLTNYEGLRHQIERLVRENEELKKLVRLIRENHELKSAIKTQAGGLGISGFSLGLGEAAASPSQRLGNCKTAGREGRVSGSPGERAQLLAAGMVAPAGEGRPGEHTGPQGRKPHPPRWLQPGLSSPLSWTSKQPQRQRIS